MQGEGKVFTKVNAMPVNSQNASHQNSSNAIKRVSKIKTQTIAKDAIIEVHGGQKSKGQLQKLVKEPAGQDQKSG